VLCGCVACHVVYHLATPAVGRVWWPAWAVFLLSREVMVHIEMWYPEHAVEHTGKAGCFDRQAVVLLPVLCAIFLSSFLVSGKSGPVLGQLRRDCVG